MYFSGYSSPVTVVQAVQMMQPQRIIITYGTNNTAESTETFIKWYRTALEQIHEAYPYADIIINSIPPVAQKRSYPNITMKTIDAFNKALVELAKEEGYTFLNSAEVLKDSTGYAKAAYMESSDGIHLSREGMDVLFDYIRTHAHETEDTRPALKSVPTHIATPEEFFAAQGYPCAGVLLSTGHGHAQPHPLPYGDTYAEAHGDALGHAGCDADTGADTDTGSNGYAGTDTGTDTAANPCANGNARTYCTAAFFIRRGE